MQIDLYNLMYSNYRVEVIKGYNMEFTLVYGAA